MKKIIASIVWLFTIIFEFFFKKEKKVIVKPQRTSAPMVRYSNQPIIPKHNNRKNTDGRYTQYINMEDGSQRPVFHSAKA